MSIDPENLLAVLITLALITSYILLKHLLGW